MARLQVTFGLLLLGLTIELGTHLDLTSFVAGVNNQGGCVTLAEEEWEPGQPSFDNATRREVTAAVGRPAYMHCRVKNLQDRAVSWIRKRDLHIMSVGLTPYSSDGRVSALHADGSEEWTLRIAPAQPRDVGLYECQVSTEPKISLSFTLNVVVSRAEILSGPELFVREGSDINLTCIVHDAPDPPDPPSYMYWYRDGMVVNYATRGGISVEHEQRARTSRLLIARAVPRDSGNYTCAPTSSDSSSILVHVLRGERPEAMQSSSPRLRVTHTLTCLFILRNLLSSPNFLLIFMLCAQQILYMLPNVHKNLSNVEAAGNS